MNMNNLDSALVSETFGQDASFRLEQPIGSMSISPSGRDVVLASRDGLHIVDLDSPWSPPRYLAHRTPWEVADVQWSPFGARDYWIVSTSNQKALVWNVGIQGSRDAIEFVLHGHSRALTDINFSAHHPDMLATCAVDSFVHGWDLRAPARPAFSFSDWFAGATQVKWSRLDEHIVASSHDRFLHIWDKRKGAYPARTIEAHGTKIYGVDWNRFEPTKIVTCSLDKTVKFWDIDNPSDVPDQIIKTPFPVWRARHTPFGWGLLAMPQRGSNDLHLYDRRSLDAVPHDGQAKPVMTFKGHSGPVKEFLWRTQGTIYDGIDHRDFQLVSWGTDRELRLHHVAEDVFHDVGYEKGVTRQQKSLFTRKGARYRTFRDSINEPYSPSEYTSRTDSFPLQSQFLNSRSRHSTNIGMSKVHVAQFRGWLNGGRRDRRTGMHGKGAARQDMNPIAWMKNVKIASWDPDSLADEITQVGEKFNRVEFESAEIRQRRAVMSLQGPWGENSSMIYVRVEFRFPKAYPRAASAVVHVQKKNSMDADVHRLLSTEVRTIAETCASRQRGCVEPVIRYLLHEQTLEQIVSILLGENLSDSKILDAAEVPDDLSSDSDDENLNGAVDNSSSSANIRVPLAKLCGAIWSNDGRLVCFFPRRSTEPASLLTGLGEYRSDNAQSSRLFEGFGRLQTSSPARKQNNGTQGDGNDSDSETSDAPSMFSSSSSSSSSSSEAAAIIRDRFTPYGGGISLGLRQRSQSGDRSNKSTTIDGTKVTSEVKENYVSIHDYGDLLPAKADLAAKYRVLGDGKQVCLHNASVATEARLFEVASVWKLAALILERNVPLDVMSSQKGGQPDILLVARRSMLALQRKDSAVDLSHDYLGYGAQKNPGGMTRWGNSPLATTYLITAMFSYFEKMADTQMLAILSCVFMQAQQQSAEFKPSHRGMMIGSTTQERASNYFANADVAISVLDDADTSNSKSSTNTVTRTSRANSGHHLSVPSSSLLQRRFTLRSEMSGTANDGLRIGSREAQASTDLSKQSVHRSSEKSHSLSTSPDDSRSSRRSTLGSTFAASRASLSALAQAYGRSPPSNNSTAASSLKKPSPSTSFTPGNWSGTLFGRDPNGRNNSRLSTQASDLAADESHSGQSRSSISSVHLHGSRGDSRKTIQSSRGSAKSAQTVYGDSVKKSKPAKKRTIRTRLHNQDQFDLDGYADQPLLDPALSWKYSAYQTAYAGLLEVWNLWVQRAEIMQMNVPVPTNLSGRPRRAIRNAALEIGLDAVRCCHDCGNPLKPILKNDWNIVGWRCASPQCMTGSSKVSKNQICSICQTIVRGLIAPCLQCGHITCYDCAKIWFGTPHMEDRRRDSETSLSQDEQRSDPQLEGSSESRPVNTTETSCPTGCGCSCTTVNDIKVSYPLEDEDIDVDPEITILESNDQFTHYGIYDKSNQKTNTTNNNVPPSISRHESGMSSYSIRSNTNNTTAGAGGTGTRPTDGSGPGPETALGSMIALSNRSRAPSTTTTTTTTTHHPSRSNNTITAAAAAAAAAVAAASDPDHAAAATTTTTATQEDELMPWAASHRFSGFGLGKGIGGGLSRGLSTRSSDATIRKI